MRGLEEIIAENARTIPEIDAELLVLEVKRRKLFEKRAELQWEIDLNKRGR
jgi:hypothetical protein